MLSNYEDTYAGLVSEILQNGEKRQTRNQETLSLFSRSFWVDSSADIPLLSGRYIYFGGVLGEIAAMFNNPKNVKDFEAKGCNYWDKWADKEGKLNLDYGNVWNDFEGYNQMEAVVKSLKEDPMSRRHIITGWRPYKLKDLSLPCCHMLYQWYVTNEGELQMMWYQRSVDVIVGLPSNVIMATAWNQLLANEVGLKPGRVNFILGDCHIYTSYLDNVYKYMSNIITLVEWEHKYKPSQLSLNLVKGAKVADFDPKNYYLQHYEPIEKLKFEVPA